MPLLESTRAAHSAPSVLRRPGKQSVTVAMKMLLVDD
jgi:hypothetical protein